MEDLRALRGTCRFMRRVCRNLKVGRRINLGRVSSSNRWRNTITYLALLYRLTNIGNPEACFIIGMHAIFPGPMFTSPGPVLDEDLERAAAGGHKATSYVAAVLLYMANGGAGIDATSRQYMRQAGSMGEEDSVAAPAGGGGTMWLDYLSCRHAAQQMIWNLINWDWPRPKKPVLLTRADDHLCASENCGTYIHFGGVPWMTKRFCSQDCRLHGEIELFSGIFDQREYY
ncbi:hypothetical protein PVAP13_7KG077727 [Panicum virgatum]|uniref:Uncharacterized protein n=1 Tax=Panicum virgatum TaxID=38727 RepID=A0A8T0Q9U1_PANVG|nr:hypothetical protein PVAP13_7KG077727 [Panicum virgatum]